MKCRVSNLGGTFPRLPVLKLVDTFTIASCIPPSQPPKDLSTLKGDLITSAFSCVEESEKHRCVDGAGSCQIERDGYFIVNILCVMIGLVTFVLYIRPVSTRLQALPLRAWRLAAGERR